MHYVAGALLVADFVLIWILDKSVVLKGLDYVAMATWLVAMVLLFLPMRTLRRQGRVPPGESFVDTEALVNTGIYALVRHPLYLGWMLMYLVVFLFNPNWALAAIGVVGTACVWWFTRQEEQLLLARFGESYQRYMHTTPRFNLLAGIIRLQRDRRRS